MIKFRKIRSQLQITLGVLVLTIISISGIVHFTSAKESLFKKYHEREFPLVVLKSAQSDLQAILEKAIETSELLAEDPTLLAWFKEDYTDPVFKHLSLSRLNNIHKNGDYRAVFAVNANTLDHWSQNFIKIDMLSEKDDDDSWYFDAIKVNKKTTLNFDHNNELGETILFVNVLMYEKDGVVGIAGVGVESSGLVKEFNHHKPSENDNLWLVDGKGKVVMCSDVNEINQALSQFLNPSIVDEILLDKDKGIIEHRLVKDNTDVAFLRLSNTEYKLVIETRHDDLFPILVIIRNQTFWFSLIFLIVTLFVVSVLSKKITTPLQRLQNVSERFADGDLEVRIDGELITRNDEIGSLANAFNCMKSQLSMYIEKVNNSNVALNREKEQLKFANDQLNIAIDKASESERLTQSFLANISHEIRTPMNSILGFSQLLESVEFDSGDYKEYVGHVVKGGQQLLTILDSIINLSKIESGFVKPVAEPININKLLKDTHDLYKVLAQQKGLRMHLELDETLDDLKMVTDIALFQMVLNNLLSNAVKYTNEGFVNIGFKHTPETVEFYISDTGIGIASDEIEAVFKPFRQVILKHTETTNDGAGLGLAIVSKILNILGGSVKVHSELGNGSVFYVAMPLIKD